MQESYKKPEKKPIINPGTKEPVTREWAEKFFKKIKTTSNKDLLTISDHLNGVKNTYEDEVLKDFMCFLAALYDAEIETRRLAEIKRRADSN
ncbi:MAG: hypothetical protein ACHQVK_01800 [Candidatus Paceibacterales bacterium]